MFCKHVYNFLFFLQSEQIDESVDRKRILGENKNKKHQGNSQTENRYLKCCDSFRAEVVAPNESPFRHKPSPKCNDKSSDYFLGYNHV